MKRYIVLLNLLFISINCLSQQSNSKLWYKKPAAVSTEALPVGNGRLGAMVFGGADDELLQLNEATLWSGGPVKKNINPEAYTYLPQVRAAIFSGDYIRAKQILKKIQGVYSENHLPLADVSINSID
jgi:alpha-L-fucosidase 2